MIHFLDLHHKADLGPLKEGTQDLKTNNPVIWSHVQCANMSSPFSVDLEHHSGNMSESKEVHVARTVGH